MQIRTPQAKSDLMLVMKKEPLGLGNTVEKVTLLK